MSEDIELKSLHVNKINGTDSEEYHEISQVGIEETIFASAPVTPITEYDFFIQNDVSNVQKQRARKKKTKKKVKQKSIMDIIDTEIASDPVLIKNKITMIDNSIEHCSYLHKSKQMPNILQHRSYRKYDTENGLRRNHSMNISPIFPRVLENAIQKQHDTYPQYVEPSSFCDIIKNNIEEGSKRNTRFLEITLKNITFKHHHEFSLEKLLCVKLVKLYDSYKDLSRSIKYLEKDIEVNRRTRNNLREQLLKISPNKKDTIRFDKNVLVYTKLLLEYKEKLNQTFKSEKELIHQMASLWADIETVREKTGVTTTFYQLDIVNNNLQQTEFNQQWSQLFENEYSDMLIKIEYDFIKQYQEYKEFKRSNSFEENNSNEKMTKPKLEIDYEKVKHNVESIIADTIKTNSTEIFLKEDSKLKTASSKSSYENTYYFKVYVDEVLVCQSEQYFNKDYTDIDFVESLSVEILQQNKFLKLYLLENNEIMSHCVINLFDIQKNSTESSFLRYDFVYENIIVPSDKQVGSGYGIKDIATRHRVRLKASNLFKGKLMTTFEVNIKLGWNENLNDKHDESVLLSLKTGQQIKRLLHGKDTITIDRLIEIINNLYENNIEENHSIMNLLKDICRQRTKRNDNTNIFEVENTEYNRFKLLNLRSNGGLTNIENKVIPLHASQISTEQLNCLQNNEDTNIDYHNLISESEKDPIDLQRYIGIKYVEKLNKTLLLSANELLLKKTYKDVVRDVEDLSLKSLFTNQMNFSLGETPSVTKREFLKEYLSKEQDIHVTVLRAFNLADRNGDIAEEKSDDESIAGYKVHPLRPFVRISYNGVSAQTAVAIGCHPTWNYTAKIKRKLEPLSVIKIDIFDECQININEKLSDEESTQSTVHYRKYNKWIGTLNVPMYALLNIGNIRGTFKINSPPLILGYENNLPKESQTIIPEVIRLMKKDTTLLTLQITTGISYLAGFQAYNLPIPKKSEDDIIIQHLNEFVTKFHNDFPARNISLTFMDSVGRNKCVTEFLQPIAIPDLTYFPKETKKVESALSKSSGYSKSSSSKSSRKKQSLAEEAKEPVNKDGEIDQWRSGENSLTKNMDAAIRYVSLIPTYEISESHFVTLTGLELLKVLYGSPLDHTILLASYFIYLGIQCWIVVGFGLPRGLSSYVLVKYRQNKVVMVNDQVKNRGLFGKSDGIIWYVYDAVLGERHELREIGCPLKTVAYVFDYENIWVNVQMSQDCESVSFDFSKSSDWQTVFTKPLFIPKLTISENIYTKPTEVEGLRQNLELKIKNKIQKWRSHVKTIWNRYCSSLLREMLPHWEYWAFNPSQPRPGFGHRLKQLMSSYKIFGFPLNMPYINMKLIISNIKSTSIHINEDPSVEFALGVEVFAYPNGVLSVWVFLATIQRL